MNKHTGDKKKPEAVAKELENIDFAEIEAADLRDVFGEGIDLLAADCNCGSNVNCPPGSPGANFNCGCGSGGEEV